MDNNKNGIEVSAIADNNVFYRVQICGIDGGDIRHEDFSTFSKAETYYNECEFDHHTETRELYKMIENGGSVELADIIL